MSERASERAPEGGGPPTSARVRRVLRGIADALRTRAPFDPHCLESRDPEVVAALQPILEAFARRYLRLRVSGQANLTNRPALYVANHNGGILGPDLLCTLSVLWGHLGPTHPLYALAHDFAMRRVPPFGRVIQRAGGLRAHPDCARRALGRGGSVLVYPGGDLEAFRHYRRKNEVVFGPRAGFVRVARAAAVPIVPIVAEGAHSSGLILHEGEWLARALGLTAWSRIERFPIALALPWGVAAGPWVPYLPLPFPVQLRVLPAMDVNDDRPVEHHRDRVTRAMQTALHDLANARGDGSLERPLADEPPATGRSSPEARAGVRRSSRSALRPRDP